MIGFLVQQLDLDRVDRERARQQVDAALRAHRGVDRWTSTLREAANEIVARVHPFQAAGGDLTFDNQIGRWPHGEKIALIQVPAGRSPLPSFTTP